MLSPTLLTILVNKVPSVNPAMKLSTKGRYGTRALLDLALHWDEGPILLRDIAQRQQIPLPYLEHLIAPLKAAGIIKSTRGARGGIWLAKPPQEVRLSEVIQLLEGPMALVDCVNNPQVCPHSDLCATRHIWCEIRKAINSVLESVTLQDLVCPRGRVFGQPEKDSPSEAPASGSVYHDLGSIYDN
jgi:Rrf2 family cysteine metabolism transcriptional repressor